LLRRRANDAVPIGSRVLAFSSSHICARLAASRLPAVTGNDGAEFCVAAMAEERTERMALRLGLIGCGGMGRILARVIRDCVPEARVVVGYDPFEPAQAGFNREFAAAGAGSLDELLSRVDVDAVLIATPNHLHCDQTLAAAAAGKHVFCEKPMALSVGDCDRMIAACKEASLKLMVGHSARLKPLARRLREFVASGELGEPRHGHATYLFSQFKERESGLWHVNRDRSGGVLFHIGVHQIDLFHAIFGPVRRVQYAGGHYGSQVRDFDDIATILVEFASAATGVITVASVSPVPVNEAVFVLSQGYARLGDQASYLEFWAGPKQLARIESKNVSGPDAVECELRSFTGWVLHDEPPVLTGAEGRAAVAVAEAAQRARQTGGAVEVTTG